ncbi:MAG TPA: hypothetical protein VMJ10_06475 [Kofleriaceae bacterium]|nr:hypothetical protein [Kofleriaceae bacterium]
MAGFRTWVILAVLVAAPRGARADDALIWRGDRSTCLASRADLDALGLPPTWYDLGAFRDPEHAGWAALDAGCGRTRLAIEIARAPLTGQGGVASVLLPLRIRIGDDWTAYATPVATISGATELGNTPLALSRRVRALSPWQWLTTIDAAVLAPTASSATDRASGLGAGAGVLRAISTFDLRATTAFDASRALQSGHIETGGTLVVGADVYPRDLASVVADVGQRVDRAGYHAWAALGVRVLVARAGPLGGLGFELAAARDRTASSGWFSAYVLR